MKVLKLLILIIIILNLINILSANELKIINDLVNINFKQDLRIIKFNNSSNLNTDINTYGLSGDKKAMAFFWVGIAGAITNFVGLSLLIPGAVMLGLHYSNSITHANYEQRIAFISGGAALLGIGSFLFIGGAAMMIVGFILFHHFGGKFAMFMEHDIKNEVVHTGFALKI